jgi:uncharacterized protein (TIGR03067 family)
VLCYLAGVTYPDAAARLGLPVGTLSGRLTRARALLKAALTRRGVAFPAGLLALPVADAADPLPPTLISSATAFAAGQPVSGVPAAVASGVLRAMLLPKLLAAVTAGVLATVAVVGLGPAAESAPRPAAARPAQPTDRERLQGEWLFDAATDEGGNDALHGAYREARLTFAKNQVNISATPFAASPVGTSFRLDPAASPKRMDWEVPPLYRTILRIPAGWVQGIYRFEDADTLTVCMSNSPVADRPTEFKAGNRSHFLFTVKRWKGNPGEPFKTATVKVLNPDGSPAAGVYVNHSYQTSAPGQWEGDEMQSWGYGETKAGGEIAVDPMNRFVIADDPVRKLMGVAEVTPAALHCGITVRLGPRCEIRGRVTSPELAKRGTAIGWTNVYLRRGRYGWAGCAATDGTFRFVAPPGEYTLDAYGERVGGRTLPVAVPPGPDAFDAGTVELPANDWGRLIGRPAPELADVIGWKGEPVKLAALRGKVVVLWFCRDAASQGWKQLGEIAAAMERYSERAVRVVAVHVTRPRHIDTPAKFDAEVMAKLAALKIDVPFPVALTVGASDFDRPYLMGQTRSQAAAEYGVEDWPFGVLIDRKGVVRGAFAPNVERDRKLFEALLAEK